MQRVSGQGTKMLPFEGRAMMERGVEYLEAMQSDAAATHCTTDLGSLRHHISACILADLNEVELRIRRATRSRFCEVDKLSACAGAMGGKRLRPLLVLLSAEVCGATHSPRETQRDDRLAIATAVELVHAASLVHDDVLDSATLRRHLPTIGSVAGNSSALLLGDFLFTRAYAVAASCRSSVPARQLAKAASSLCEGELRQQLSVGNWQVSLSEYRSLLQQKTGALCAVSCQLGAWAANATRAQRDALQRFGNLLGLAFQVFDDWLDYWGTEQVGKTLGTDLSQRKPTLPLIRLLRTASADQRDRVIGWLRNGDQDSLQAVRAELELSDARDYSLHIARRCVGQALEALEAFPASSSKSCLQMIAKFSVARTG